MSFAGFQGLSYLHEFSFILFIHHNIHIYFELCTYYMGYLSIIKDEFCSISTVLYGTILWHVWKCFRVLWVNSYQLVFSPGSHARVSMHCYPIGYVIKSTHRGICSCSPIVNFLKFTFCHGMLTSVIFLIKNNLNIHILNMKIHWVFMKMWIIFKSRAKQT